MKANNLFRLSLALVLASQSAIALSQTSAETVAKREPNFAVDVQPLPLLLNVVPGLRGANVGAEYALTDNVGVFGEVGYFQLKLSDKDLGKLQEDNKDKALPKEMTAFGANVGSRYYFTSSRADSWYAGGRLGLSKADATWAYGDERIGDKGYAITPGVEGGYRWIWDNGMLVRLGAGALVTAYNDRDIGTKAQAQTAGEREVKKQGDRRVAPLLDLGIGYAF